MEKIQIEACKITELLPDAKERALSWLAEGLDYEWWDFIYDDAKNLGKCIGLRIDNIYFSGFYNQSDGCCFSGYYRYQKKWEQIVKDYAPDNKELYKIGLKLQSIQRPMRYKLEGEITGDSRHWQTQIALDWQHKEQEEQINEVLEDFAHWIYKALQTEYEWLTSEEQLIETAEANGYLFDESGRVI